MLDSPIFKFMMVIVSILFLVFAYWFYFTPSGELWRVNQEIEKSWRSEPVPVSKPVQQRKTSQPTRKAPERRKEVKRNPNKSLTSSSKSPIILEGKRNYITGDSITYIVPSDMRRLKLTIQDRVGRRLNSYTLPNAFISVKKNQRINIEVQ